MRPLKFVFIACNRSADRFRQDASFFYRCDNVGSALRILGHKVYFAHISRINWNNDYDVAVFHRPKASLRLNTCLLRFRKRRTYLFADFDDLIFRPAFAQYSPAVLQDRLPLNKVKQHYVGFRRALGKFDHAIVSTLPLKEQVHAVFPGINVLILPNAIPHAWLHLKNAKYEKEERFITYFPGTYSHNRDFRLFSPSISEFLRANSAVKLSVTGLLDFSLNVRPQQIVRQGRVPFAEYHSKIQKSWVNLAPLENSPFTQCKSAIKVMEAAFWGKPTLCSPIDDTLRFSEAGALFIQKPNDIIEFLEELKKDSYYESVTHKLRQRALDVANVEHVAGRFIKVCNARYDSQ